MGKEKSSIWAGSSHAESQKLSKYIIRSKSKLSPSTRLWSKNSKLGLGECVFQPKSANHLDPNKNLNIFGPKMGLFGKSHLFHQGSGRGSPLVLFAYEGPT